MEKIFLPNSTHNSFTTSDIRINADQDNELDKKDKLLSPAEKSLHAGGLKIYDSPLYRIGKSKNSLFSVPTGQFVRYYVWDHLGSTRLTIRKYDGAIIEEAKYLPFGKGMIANNESDGISDWAGYSRDAESEVDYLGFRHYNNGIFRFIQPDKINGSTNNTNNWNSYGYVTNNPMNYIDLYGLVENQITVKCNNPNACEGTIKSFDSKFRLEMFCVDNPEICAEASGEDIETCKKYALYCAMKIWNGDTKKANSKNINKGKKATFIDTIFKVTVSIGYLAFEGAIHESSVSFLGAIYPVEVVDCTVNYY
jgi:RHS repeat-associated protein